MSKVIEIWVGDDCISATTECEFKTPPYPTTVESSLANTSKLEFESLYTPQTEFEIKRTCTGISRPLDGPPTFYFEDFSITPEDGPEMPFKLGQEYTFTLSHD